MKLKNHYYYIIRGKERNNKIFALIILSILLVIGSIHRINDLRNPPVEYYQSLEEVIEKYQSQRDVAEILLIDEHEENVTILFSRRN